MRLVGQGRGLFGSGATWCAAGFVAAASAKVAKGVRRGGLASGPDAEAAAPVQPDGVWQETHKGGATRQVMD